MNPSHISADHDACGVGLVTRIGGGASREIVERALEALIRLAHRGGVDADGRSGDGAGLLTAIPDKLIRKNAKQAGISCRRAGMRRRVMRSRRKRKQAACTS